MLAFAGRPHESGELDNRAGGLEHRLAAGPGGRVQANGRRRTGGVGHLRRQGALPDQPVEFRLVRRHFTRHIVRIAEAGTRRTDAFVRFLCPSGLGRVLFRGVGEEFLAEVEFDSVACRSDRLLRQGDGIGTHICDETVLVQPLRGPHRLAGAHAEPVAGRLLQSGCGERRQRTPAVWAGFHRFHSEWRFAQHLRNLRGPFGVQLADIVREARRRELAVRAEILGCSESFTAELHHTRVKTHRFAFSTRRRQRRHDIPVGGLDEGHTLAFPLDDQARGHRLHTAGRQSRTDLAPQHWRKLIAIETVKHTPGLLRVHHMVVNISSVGQRCLDRLRRDFMEHHALDGDLRLKGLHEMPCNRFAFAILISRQIELVGVFQCVLELRHGFLLVRTDDVIRLESVIHINAELAEFVLLRCGHLAWLGKVADMTDRCEHGISIPEVSRDFLRFRRRLHDNELCAGCHCPSLRTAYGTP